MECRRVLVRFCVQAEDGIRDIGVTGVQTCALPISVRPGRLDRLRTRWSQCMSTPRRSAIPPLRSSITQQDRKSVVKGKSVDLGGRRIIKKKTRPDSRPVSPARPSLCSPYHFYHKLL